MALCLTVRGEDGGSFVTGTADFRSRLEVAGSQGCADAFGNISVVINSDPILLGTFRAFEDGSFHRIFCLPAAIDPGRHTVEVSVEGRGTASRALVVQDENKELCGPGDGTVVLGRQQPNTGRSGVLPKTGAGILLLLLWALVLVGLGTLLALSAWRYRERLAPAAIRSRLRRGHETSGAPEVALIDTSRFVPYRSRWANPNDPASGAGSHTERTLTEWDAAQAPSDRGPRPS